RMGVQPEFGAAVAGLATDAIGHLEAVAALVGGDRVCVAIEADFGLGRIADAELAPDGPGCLAAESLPGLGMRVEFLPDSKLVLQHVGIAERLRCAVTDALAATGHAKMLVGFDRTDRRWRCHCNNRAQRQQDEQCGNAALHSFSPRSHPPGLTIGPSPRPDYAPQRQQNSP